MPERIHRRELLVRGLGTAGLVIGGGLPALGAGQSKTKRPDPGPDRSRQAPSQPVAIARCPSYEPQLLRRKLDEAMDQIGGLKKLVEGKSVTIKLNLTGGPKAGKLGGREPHETYHVHPNLVAALCAALNDAGAKRMVIVESSYYLEPPEKWMGEAGWEIRGIKEAGGNRVTFIDTRNRGPFPSYSRLAVPWGGFLYPAFDVCAAYEKTDVFVSLGKMKDHGNAGVTMALKNLFGIAPISLYGGDAPNEDSIHYRGPIIHFGEKKPPAGVPGELEHGVAVGDWSKRVPRATADMVGCRPIDLAVIDGIFTNRGGEGPWLKGVEPLEPKLIFVGRNAVCTDAVCTAAMGYDPQADHYQFPFMGENHLKLLASVGLGTIDPGKIEVRGLSIKEAVFPFNPQRKKVAAARSWIDWNRARLCPRAMV